MIEPLLPPQQSGGRRWRDHRQVINAILWKPRLWTADGTWDKILDHVIVKDDSVGDLEWVISVDSSVVRAHRHSAGARKKGCGSDTEALALDGEGLGRSRGGLGTKIHLAVDNRRGQSAVGAVAGWHQRRPDRAGPATMSAGGDDRGQGVFASLHP